MITTRVDLGGICSNIDMHVISTLCRSPKYNSNQKIINVWNFNQYNSYKYNFFFGNIYWEINWEII